MNILIIGGTQFLGRNLVEAALQLKHNVTLFNRGKTNPGLFSEQVKHICGDREKDLALLDKDSWDAVIDTCGYIPRITSLSANALLGRARQYVFISSISAYSDFSQIGLTEDAPLTQLDDPTIEEVNGATYGGLKVLCERSIQEAFGEQALIIRPGLIVGPHDPTDRLTYWIHRIGTEQRLLVPRAHSCPLQFIFALDLARWIISMIERNKNGRFNATGPSEPLSFMNFLDTCSTKLNSECELIQADEKFLSQNGFPDWQSMPLWLPSTETKMAGFFAADCSRAQQAGLQHSDLNTIIQETFDWSISRGTDYQLKLGIDRDKELKLIDKLQNTGK